MPASRTEVSPRAAFIRGLAAVQGLSLAAIQEASGVHASVFYRVVRGERTSAKVDRLICRFLGVKPDTLRQLNKSSPARG